MRYKKHLTALGLLTGFASCGFSGIERLHTADFIPDIPHSRTVLFLYHVFGNPAGVAVLCGLVAILTVVSFKLYRRARSRGAAGIPLITEANDLPVPYSLEPPGSDNHVRKRTSSTLDIRIGRFAHFKREKEIHQVKRQA